LRIALSIHSRIVESIDTTLENEMSQAEYAAIAEAARRGDAAYAAQQAAASAKQG
jgi:hypothetical protein